MTLVRVPEWAIATDCLPRPEEGETFDSYWERVGIDAKVIDWAKLGLDRNPCLADNANDRMGGYLRRTMPDAFARYVDALQGSHRRIRTAQPIRPDTKRG